MTRESGTRRRVAIQRWERPFELLVRRNETANLRFSLRALAFRVEMSAARPRTKENVFLFVPNLIGQRIASKRWNSTDDFGQQAIRGFFSPGRR